MMNFNTKTGALVLAVLGALYMILSLSFNHTAVGEIQIDLTPQKTTPGLTVWEAAALIVKNRDSTVVVDIRDNQAFDTFNIPGSRNIPRVEKSVMGDVVKAGDTVILVTDENQAAEELIASMKAWSEDTTAYYLKDGIRSWYLTFELPVPLFNDQKSPYGYDSALETVKDYFDTPQPGEEDNVTAALATLARLNYQPNLLGAPKKTARANKKVKKISGGCD